MTMAQRRNQESEHNYFVSNIPLTKLTLQWFYAFSIAPASGGSAPKQALPTNATSNPFTSPLSSQNSSGKRPVDMAEAENFIFGVINQPHLKRARRGGWISLLAHWKTR